MSIPPKPDAFTADGAPAGVEVKFVTFLADRPAIVPRALHFHTNAAQGEGSVESAWNWTHAKPNQNTLPHYQLDRTHNGVTRCRKMLPTNRKGIGSSTVPAYRDPHGNVADWTIVIETADTGTNDDPTISAFDDGQLELAAAILAYEAALWGFPLWMQPEWYSPGVASHTDPFGYPYTTLYNGKICPGDKKKAQVRDVILPRAVEIRDAWLAPPEPPKETTDMLALAKLIDDPNTPNNESYHVRRGDGNVATVVRAREWSHLIELYQQGKAPNYRHPITGDPITAANQVPLLNETQLDLWVGYVDGNSMTDEG